MKRTVRVIIEKEFELDIPDNLLTEKHIKDFESYIGAMGSEDKVAGLFQYVARCAAYGWNEAEGMGELGSESMKQYSKDKTYFIAVEETYDDIETEMVE